MSKNIFDNFRFVDWVRLDWHASQYVYVCQFSLGNLKLQTETHMRSFPTIFSFFLA